MAVIRPATRLHIIAVFLLTVMKHKWPMVNRGVIELPDGEVSWSLIGEPDIYTAFW